MLRLSLATALAATFLLSFSLNSTQAQNLRTTVQRTDPGDGPSELVQNPDPILDDGIPLPGDGGLELKMAVGFERWLPEAPPNPDTIITEGAGWFYCNNLSPIDLNITFPSMGFRAIDIEVEQWDPVPVFSAVFVQNTGKFEVADSFVMVAPEQDIRDWLFGGEWTGYRIIDLEVHRSHGYVDLEADPVEITILSDEIAVLIVPNEGNQYTPEWDFVVHATPIELLGFQDSFAGDVRIIDNEISFDAPGNFEHDGEFLQDVVYSQIMVADEGVEHVETSIFQYTTPLELWALEQEGWQLIDSERNIPMMSEDFPEYYGAFTGVFVQKPNTTEFYEELNGYTDEPEYTTESKRMIDLELVPDGGSFLLDELYLLYN
jgi:hypothetical protein